MEPFPHTDLAILGATLVLVIVPVVGLLIWMVRHLLSQTLPKDKEELREIYERQIREDRDLFRDEFRKLTESVQDLTSATRTNQKALEALLSKLQ